MSQQQNGYSWCVSTATGTGNRIIWIQAQVNTGAPGGKPQASKLEASPTQQPKRDTVADLRAKRKASAKAQLESGLPKEWDRRTR